MWKGRSQRSSQSAFCSLFLLISLVINYSNFNRNFVYAFNENLGLLNGMRQVRQLLDQEASKGKNLVFFDYEHGDTFNPTRLTLLRGSFEYDVFKHFKMHFPEAETMWQKLADGTFDSIYLVMAGPLDRRGKLALFRGFRSGYNHNEYYSFPDNYLVTKDRMGIPLFFVNKLESEKRYITQEISSGSKAEITVSFSLGENEGLRFIDIPGSVKELALKGTSIAPLIIGLPKIAYDQLHLTFDHSSLIEVFNNYKSGVDKNNIVELAVGVVDAIQVTGQTIDPNKKIGPNSVAFVPQADKSQMSYVVFNYIVGFPVKEVFINVPFFLFNDKAKENSITVQWRHKEGEPWRTVSCVRSNGNERFGTFLFKENDAYFTDNMVGIFKPGGMRSFQIRYLLKRSKTDDQGQVGIFSTYEPSSDIRANSRNLLRITIDTGELKPFKKDYKDKLEFTAKLRESRRHPRTRSLIGLGTELH